MQSAEWLGVEEESVGKISDHIPELSNIFY